MSNLNDKMSAVFKKDTAQGHAERCKENDENLGKFDDEYKEMLENTEKISQFKKQKNITLAELKKNFKLEKEVEYQGSFNSKLCESCKSTETEFLDTDSWLGGNYCKSCNSITIGIRADRMSGNFIEPVYLFKDVIKNKDF